MSQSLNQSAFYDWIKEKASEKFKNSGGTLSDADIADLQSYITSNGYSFSGTTDGSSLPTDGFLSDNSKAGYSEDTSQMKADVYKTMCLVNDVANHLKNVEARLIALENKMSTLSVGGVQNWNDGGSDGTDNNWNVDEWYKSGREDVETAYVEDTVKVDFNFNSGQKAMYIYRSNLSQLFQYSAIDDLSISVKVSFTGSAKHTGISCLFEAGRKNDSSQDMQDIIFEDLTLGTKKIRTETYRDSFPKSKLPFNGDCDFDILFYLEGNDYADVTGKVVVEIKADLRAS